MFTPIQVEQRELSEDLEPIEPIDARHTVARVLLRLHSQPVGLVDVALPAGPEELDLDRAGLEPMARARVAERDAVLGDPPFASVVIPTRDRPEMLERTLATVLDSEYQRERFEVIVADNVPTDSRTRELVEGRARYVLAERPGSAAARNDGAAAAHGELVAFVDDDALVDRHWLAELATGFSVADDVTCVTGLVLPLELDTPAQQLFQEYGGFGKGLEQVVFRGVDPRYPFAPGRLGSGNNVAFRREALFDLGGYDEHLGNGTPTRSGEDWELFLRLLRAGRTAVYRPGAIVHHRDRREYDELREQVRDYGVGMGAAITRTLAHDPRVTLELARRVPRVARYLLSGDSPKNRNQSGGYPAELRRAELAGILRGPFAYLRSRRV
jgi:glycosyltransferase involved in cell wall biosynthesis